MWPYARSATFNAVGSWYVEQGASSWILADAFSAMTAFLDRTLDGAQRSVALSWPMG